MPIKTEFTLTFSENAETDVSVSFDLILRKKDGTEVVTNVNGVIKKGTNSVTIKIDIPGVARDELDESGGRIENVNINPPIIDSLPIQSILEAIQYKNAPPPPPPPPPPTPPPASPSSTPLLRKAVEDQIVYTYTKYANSMRYTYLCAGWTYQFCRYIKTHIDNNSPSAIPFTWLGGGDGCSVLLRTNIKKTGIYDEYYIGRFTAGRGGVLQKEINKISWNYGDIAVYWDPNYCADGTRQHAQMYTGDIFKSYNRKIEPYKTWSTCVAKGKNDYYGDIVNGWTTDNLTNYSSTMVYPYYFDPYEFYAYKIKPAYLK